MTKETNITTFILGHKNPDTDSIVSAAAYADFKQKKGQTHCIAARAGKPSPQTEYIFSRFGVEMPVLVSDLIPKVKYYYNDQPITIKSNESVWQAFNIMRENNLRFLPVVDDDGTYHSVMHFILFTENIFKITQRKKKTEIETSIGFLADVIGTKKIFTTDENEIKKSPIIIGAASMETFIEHLHVHPVHDVIVICGNRTDIQEYAVTHGVRLLIITTDNMPTERIIKLAKENNVSVLSSPYDTTSTALLLIYAMPVSTFSASDIEPVKITDTLQSAIPKLNQLPARTLAVVNDENKVIGTFSETDAHGKPNINVILVDHNEISQSVDGTQDLDIVEIIDHHRLGNIPTKSPILFMNKPVGATCTIIANMYFSENIQLDKQIASILLCGILADTLMLKSATTTQTDKETAQHLSQLTGLDIEELGTALIKASSNIANRTAEELVHQDLKEYTDAGKTYTISQIEVENLEQIIRRKDEFTRVLENIRQNGNKLFSALMITDVVRLSSIMLVAGKEEVKQIIKFPQEHGIFQLKNIVSRKKQLLPIISEIIRNGE